MIYRHTSASGFYYPHHALSAVCLNFSMWTLIVGLRDSALGGSIKRRPPYRPRHMMILLMAAPGMGSEFLETLSLNFIPYL